jgi:hypothetical protein
MSSGDENGGQGARGTAAVRHLSATRTAVTFTLLP